MRQWQQALQVEQIIDAGPKRVLPLSAFQMIMGVQSARITDFRGNSTPLRSAGGSQKTNQIQMQ